MDLIDPLVATPFRVPPGATASSKAWLRSHAWPIRVSRMQESHVDYWDAHVVPTIQRVEFERQAGLREKEPPRADAYWPYSWSSVWRVFSAANVVPVRPAGRPMALARANLWVIEVDTKSSGPVPVGMLLGLSRYPFPRPSNPMASRPLINGRPVAAVFGWQLTAAPGDTLAALDIPPTIALGRALLDTAVQVSLAARHFGLLLLHADPRGGDALTRFYSDSMMAPLSPSDFPSISTTRNNDGRYFYFDGERAGAFSRTFAHLRRSRLGSIGDPFAPVSVMA